MIPTSDALPMEYKSLLSEIREAAAIALDVFGAARVTPTTTMSIFDCLPDTEEPDRMNILRQIRDDLRISAQIAQEAFGPNASPEVAIDIFERLFINEETDDEEDDTE